MPIYEYACGSCEHRFETIQKASEDPLRDCPECLEPALKKLLSAPVFRLKGSGWYETDFKTGDKKRLAESDDGKAGADGKADGNAPDKAASADAPAKAASGDGGANGSGAGDAKPAAKPATAKND